MSIKGLLGINMKTEPIYGWLYISQPAKHVNFNTVQKISTVSYRNNRKRNLSGALIYDHRHFIQYVEGEWSVIAALREKIQLNTNHYEILTVTFGEIFQRRFKNWTMSYIGYDKYQQIIPALAMEGFNPYIMEEERLLEIIKAIQMVA